MMKTSLRLFIELRILRGRFILLLFSLLGIIPGLAQITPHGDTFNLKHPTTDIPINQEESVSPSTVTFTDWSMMGITNDDNPPYNYYFYKLLQVNADDDRYESIIELSIQGDENFYQKQGTYRIRVDKYENTNARFDGLEIRCISGNPFAASFYVYNNALWIKSNFQWGELYYRIVGNFARWSANPSPLVGGTFDKTVTAPTGYLSSTASYGLKCDFDNNVFYNLPYTDVNGNMFVDGNIGVGTKTPQSKLSVNGTVTASQVKVTQTGWPDYVFDTAYSLPTLEQVKGFINDHARLPQIPSSKEITDQGLDLGEMQKLQMKKIEELTLYLIQQQDLIKEQQAELIKLRSEIEVIRKQTES